MQEAMKTPGGELSPVDARTGKPVELAMQRLVLTGTILPVGARLEVQHVFAVAEDRPHEVVYSFMLPRDAALRRFRLEGPGFTAHSELKPAAEADRAYEKGLELGHLATFTRTHRDGVANLALGNLRGDDVVTVVLELLAGVEPSDDGYRFRFPFTMAPSYHARARVAALPEGGSIELPEDGFGDVLLPDFRTDATGLHEIGFALDVAAPLDGVEVASPSHPIRVGVRDGGLRVSLATSGEVPDRDLVLDVDVERPRIFALGGVAGDGKRHFGVVVPSTELGERQSEPRSVVFLLDRSGSMGGEPMEQARRALTACLATLGEEDRFGIVAFDSTTEAFSGALEPASRERRDAAAHWLERIDARGGTELALGVSAAARLLDDGGGDVFVLTDGQVFGTEDVLASVQKTGARLHTLGIGSASQDRFLTLLARRTGGVSRFVTPRERVDMAALDLFASISRPVATGLEVEAGGMKICDLRPEPPSAVLSGTPVVLWGESRRKTGGHLELKWTRKGEESSLRIALELDGSGQGETVRLLRGARLITDAESAMGGMAADGAAGRRTAKRLNSRLVSLSRTFGLASRAMALVAVVEREGDRPGELPVTRVVPVGLPEGMRPEGVFELPVVACYERLLREAEIGCLSQLASPDFFIAEAHDALDRESFDFEYEVRPDPLLELLTHLEPDGGASGDTPEERILATVLTLLAAAAEGSTERRGPYRAHIIRMLSFLATHRLGDLDPEKRRSVEAAIEAVRTGKVTRARWLELARDLILEAEPGAASKAWESLSEAAARGQL